MSIKIGNRIISLAKLFECQLENLIADIHSNGSTVDNTNLEDLRILLNKCTQLQELGLQVIETTKTIQEATES